ncbi:MAG TPA: tRNA pseudouridine(55) synthase TruB [Candidatus Angelobacter sp.]|nr:tRNA pseudouridine(55) synthase TruB [Candidatus Angelobacter sp.]
MGLNGVLVIDKPGGWTSHDVVAKMRHVLGERSIGHLGTLDPMATGVLPLVIGKMTRLCQFYEDSEKAYEGTIRFGFATDTYDAEGEQVGEARDIQVTLEELTRLAAGFVGTLQQVPPPFSAKKINGVPAYKLARKKQEVELRPVEVEVGEFEVTAAEGDTCQFRCRVSSGTYVRSLAHEMGQNLGCGAHLASLRRTRVAEFGLEESHTLEEVAAAVKVGNLDGLMVHLRRVLLEIPCVTADEETLGKIRHGRAVNLGDFSKSKWVKVFVGQSELVCLARRVAGSLFHPKVVLLG